MGGGMQGEYLSQSNKTPLKSVGGFGQGGPHFNPAFFNQGQPGTGDWNSQHPAKRQRAE